MAPMARQGALPLGAAHAVEAAGGDAGPAGAGVGRAAALANRWGGRFQVPPGGAPLPPPPPRTKWTRRVPHPVLIGHAASRTPY